MAPKRSAGGNGFDARRLRTERQNRPLAVEDIVPLLSWEVIADSDARRQSAYRIRLVDAGPAGTGSGDPTDEALPALWDSGLVAGSDSVDVPCRAQLAPTTGYRWAVQLHDQAGQAGAWSEVASFETGLQGTPWPAPWITSASEDPSGSVDLDWVGFGRRIRRVWVRRRGADDSIVGRGLRAGFRSRFPGPSSPVGAARLAVGSGVGVSAWLNGKAVDVNTDIDVTYLHHGDNVLAIEARADVDDHAGLLARLDVTTAEGRGCLTSTDATWRAAARPGPGWTEPSFEDRRWRTVQVLGLHGRPPFGRDPVTYRPSPYLRRAFDLSGPVAAARLRCTALGAYELTLNGSPVAADRLAPGWVDFSKSVPYQVYDVTDLLRPGRNILGAVLADGWALGYLGPCDRFHYANRRMLTATLDVVNQDGSWTTLVTDGSWRAGDGGMKFADLQNGMVFDSTDEPPAWQSSASHPAAWPPAVIVDGPPVGLQAQIAPAIRGCQEIGAVHVTDRGGGRVIVDFGQNLAGWIRLDTELALGRRVLVSYAEVLDDDGEMYLDGLRSARCTDEFVAGGGPQRFEPRFTMHGFRYCEIRGLTRPPAPSDVVAVVVHADMEPIGEFSCSDSRLDRLQQNIVWSQRDNFLAAPTDCPQRDERLGWTGDVQVFAATAAFNYDVRQFFRQWMQEVRRATGPDGSVPFVVPDVLSRAAGIPMGGSAGWGDVAAVLPYELYWAYGDRRMVEENLDLIAGWLDYCRANSTGLIRPEDGFGDWLAFDPTAHDLVNTAFFARSADLARQLAEVVGDARAQQWRELHNDIRAAFRDRFVHDDGVVGSGTQTGYVLALHFGLLDPTEQARAASALVDAIEARGGHLSTGFLGTPYLLSVLSTCGHEDVAFRLLTNETMPSWLYPIVRGDATTIWERWDAWSEERGFQDPSMTSFNHYAYGAVGAWMYRHVGGLAPLEPGYRRSLIAPRPGGDITSARAALQTPYGELACDWRIADARFRLDARVPANTTAEIVMPPGVVDIVTDRAEIGPINAGQTVEVQPGAYHFEGRMPVISPTDAHRAR